jgi:Ca-activated chloride channel homolog
MPMSYQRGKVMRPSILKWTVITAITLAGTFFFLCFKSSSSVSAAGAKTKSQAPLASLRATAAGQAVGDCPLKHTTVKAEISGFISRVTVTQEFENPFDDKIEAVYTFPLPQSAAVDDLTMVIGDRTIKGKIMRREEAKAAYESAKSLGKVASLLDQERPNIFTQSVANIMPGQQISITISYVETLKYADGSYEWIFPMVIGPRYIPNSDGGNSDKLQRDDAKPEENQRVAAADRITPPVAKGMRPGHDISLELMIDAGVPIQNLTSQAHEIDLERANERRALVHLKDQATIPNKDFVLRYQVAGQQIEDAILAHRSSQGGFFTLILQPPQRVLAADVMPKELVFVVDTSGSMDGFPIKKAKETVKWALKNLYPHDTFNLITFAGDTSILFPEPVPATEDNLDKAKEFLSSREGGGGTEMMKAIHAALEPSDSQQHVRIVCFLTDGLVGNDLGIIGEVQKHPNARIFSMGFSDAPNRFLLDKMAEYGRGEVEYISENGNTADVARRFNERIRNPLMTDISVEWEGLALDEVYPKRIPDLFNTKPVMLTGRYSAAGKGTIRLRGMMAGQKFVREIPVELPEAESRHDVLGSLWARQKIDQLMGQDMPGLQAGTMREAEREEITKLGLEFKLMTQFTSFVAVDNVIFTPGGDPRRVEVPAAPTPITVTPPVTSASTTPAGYVPNAAGVGGISEVVTVEGVDSTMSSSSAEVATTIRTKSIDELPLQGRNVESLFLLAPGTAPSSRNSSAFTSESNESVNGQRASSNQLSIDGVSANFGIAPGGESPNASAAGTSPALTAAGGTNGLFSQSAVQEIRIRFTHIEPEYGRSTGGNVSVVTRAGTNAFHGSLFHYFGNDAVDAGDWFANRLALTQPARRLNNFGGTLGGPVRKDKGFFFLSYEGLRLRQPMTAITDVPSVVSRQAAPVGIRPFLEAFPLPNGLARADGFAAFAATFSNPARHDVAILRLDENVNSKLALTGLFSFADSAASQRGNGGFSLNTMQRIRSRANTLTGGLSYLFSSSVATDLRANFSRLRVHGSYLLDDFGGALVPEAISSSAPTGSFSFNLNGRAAALMAGDDVASTQRQFNLIDATTVVSGPHELKFGVDFRRLSPIIGLRTSEQSVLFDGVTQALKGVAARVNSFSRSGSPGLVFNNLSLYGQDQWRLTPKITLSYGLRWELNPAPAAHKGRSLAAVTQIFDPSNLDIAPENTSLWRTTYTNFAPRVSLAYQLSDSSGQETVLRGGVGLFYDSGQDQVGDAYANSYPLLAGRSIFNSAFPAQASPTAPSHVPGNLPFYAFDPALKLPYSWQWNVSIERELGNSQSFYVGYIGSTGRRLVRTQTVLNSDPDYAFLRLIRNGASADYHALQLRFERHISRSLSGFASYTWSKSLDNSIQDSAAKAFPLSSDARNDRGPSDFDIRHTASGTISYQLPSLLQNGSAAPLLRNWNIDSIFSARSARPVNVVYDFPTSLGFAYLRPDLVNGAPLYLLDSNAPGGRVINPAAFLTPASLRQGTLGRNSLRGFPFFQIDLALRRSIKLSETFSLQLQTDAFNLLNHPNFADPAGSDLSLGSKFTPLGALSPRATFGQSASLSGRSILSGGEGGFGSFYSTGGPRALRFSVKLAF